MIAIADYNVGNLGAVANMFRRLGFSCVVTTDPEDIARATHIVLPGNGAFDACVRRLRASALLPAIEERVLNQGVPLLGICVGAQMLGRSSEEGSEQGLGWLDLDVKRLPPAENVRVPHMGWEDVELTRPEHPLLRRLDSPARFYFCHAYYMRPANDSLLLMAASAGIEFAAAVARENVVGVQFHPEKSHRFGRQLLAAFAGTD